MFLETERLILRKFQEEDFADFREFIMDPERCRMVGCDPIPDLAAARNSFDWFLHREERAYAIVYKENNKVIGNLSVTQPSAPCLLKQEDLAGKTGCTLSFSLSRSYRRRDLMTEAVQGVIDRLFRLEGMDYINCGYFSYNAASRELQKKLGFPTSPQTISAAAARKSKPSKISSGERKAAPCCQRCSRAFITAFFCSAGIPSAYNPLHPGSILKNNSSPEIRTVRRFLQFSGRWLPAVLPPAEYEAAGHTASALSPAYRGNIADIRFR